MELGREAHIVKTMTDASCMRSNVGGKVPKYTTSCDSCNEAKVHCSQTRPSCARCLNVLNRRCIYGVSDRSGKHGADGPMKAEGAAKNDTISRPPSMATTAFGIEVPSSSLSTIDPRQFLRPFPASGSGSSDLLKGPQLQKDWTFENSPFLPNQSSTSHQSPVNREDYQLMFGMDESHMADVQYHGQGPLLGTSDGALGTCSRNDSTAQKATFHTQSNTPCVSCSTTNRQSNRSSSLVNTCYCNEIIIMQVSSLPVLLLDNECSTFDVKLVQFQKAIKLCAGVLDCTCPGKDYTSILTIGMLIARIISFFERGGAPGGGNNGSNAPPLDTTGAMTPVLSSRFSVGTYEIEGEDSNTLRREVWWLQIRKVESLVGGFKAMVEKMTRHQVYQNNAEVAVWGNLISLLDQKAQAVKRDWSAHRYKA